MTAPAVNASASRSTLVRWLKFNLVGAIGMLVQLATLATLNRLFPGRYLWTSTAAIEVTLLHNFVWHLNYTWRDRRPCCKPRELLFKLFRFQLANGVVSVLGNLALMRLLVYHLHLPLIASNLLAILLCSIVNFALGNTWAFPATAPGLAASLLPENAPGASVR